MGMGYKLMSTRIEVAVDEGISGEEVLRLFGRFEPLHLPLWSARQPMRVPGLFPPEPVGSGMATGPRKHRGSNTIAAQLTGGNMRLRPLHILAWGARLSPFSRAPADRLQPRRPRSMRSTRCSTIGAIRLTTTFLRSLPGNGTPSITSWRRTRCQRELGVRRPNQQSGRALLPVVVQGSDISGKSVFVAAQGFHTTMGPFPVPRDVVVRMERKMFGAGTEAALAVTLAGQLLP